MKKGARIPCDIAYSLISQHYFFQSFLKFTLFFIILSKPATFFVLTAMS